MKTRELKKIGIPKGEPTKRAYQLIGYLASQGHDQKQIRIILSGIAANPAAHSDNQTYGKLAEVLVKDTYIPPETLATYKQWGKDLEPQSVQQMKNACQLPVSVVGALMPDAHLGYGLPIGGVLATDNAVIPYAVGVDIACRVKMTVLDMPVETLDQNGGKSRLVNSIEKETRFGIGSKFKNRRWHEILDEEWSVSPITKQNKDKAWSQLGTSGSGNHFVEFGVLTIDDAELGLEAGTYLALLSHSGSRGTGAIVASHYSKLAQQLHTELPKGLRQLAWLDMDTEVGQEYWAAMELMGKYAAANHACIHQHIVAHLGADILLDLENHHNFAWKEHHHGRDVIVHRKGATPASEGAIGIIPGSMASPAFVVRGKGNLESLNSAAHGAGRVMSRKKAIKTLNWKDTRKILDDKKVTLLSAGLDEVPFVYKNIEKVMADQSDLVEIIARFDPRLVKMAPHGERPED